MRPSCQRRGSSRRRLRRGLRWHRRGVQRAARGRVAPVPVTDRHGAAAGEPRGVSRIMRYAINSPTFSMTLKALKEVIARLARRRGVRGVAQPALQPQAHGADAGGGRPRLPAGRRPPPVLHGPAGRRRRVHWPAAAVVRRRLSGPTTVSGWRALSSLAIQSVLPWLARSQKSITLPAQRRMSVFRLRSSLDRPSGRWARRCSPQVLSRQETAQRRVRVAEDRCAVPERQRVEVVPQQALQRAARLRHIRDGPPDLLS